MFLDKRQIELIKKAIEDYKFMQEELNNKIIKGYELKELAYFLERFKDVDVTNFEEYSDCSYLDFLYKDINMCISKNKSKGVFVSDTFEIYDSTTEEYILESFETVEEYEKLINTSKETMLSDIVASLKYYDLHNEKDKYEKCANKIINFLKEEF